MSALEIGGLSEEENSHSLFRPVKRRKVYRKREESAADGEAPSPNVASPQPQSIDGVSEPQITAAETSLPEADLSVALRQRKLAQRRRHGIEFAASKSHKGATGDHSADAATIQQTAPEKIDVLDRVASRFSQQTGQTASVDKHMMAYIDARLSSRLDPSGSTQDELGGWNTDDDEDDGIEGNEDAAEEGSEAEDLSHSLAGAAPARGQRQPASMGKLLEIELDPGRASHRALDASAANDDDAASGRTKKAGKKRRVRLGRDGKPLPERRRNHRRGSDDAKRDRIVEDLLRENRIELYSEHPNAPSAHLPTASAVGSDLAADERMAAEFKADFMDALQSRRHAAPAAQSKSAKGKEEEKRLRGPKLGGSRSQRAVLREKELEAQRERGKKGGGKKPSR